MTLSTFKKHCYFDSFLVFIPTRIYFCTGTLVFKLLKKRHKGFIEKGPGNRIGTVQCLMAFFLRKWARLVFQEITLLFAAGQVKGKKGIHIRAGLGASFSPGSPNHS